MKNKIIITTVISISIIIAIICIFNIDSNNEKRKQNKNNISNNFNVSTLADTTKLKTIEQEKKTILNSNIFNNTLSNKISKTEGAETNAANENLVSLEIMLSGGLNIPLEGNISIRTHDFLNFYPDQNIKKEIKGDYTILFEKVIPSDCKITAEIKGYLNISTNISLSDYIGNKKNVMLSLTPLQLLRGKVIDYGTKEEIAGAELLVFNQKTYTDGAGRFLIENMTSPTVNLQVVYDNYPTQMFKVAIPKNDEPDIIIELKKMSKISGYVIDQNGSIISECKVFIPRIQIKNNKIVLHNSFNYLSQTQTDDKGFFEFEIMKTGSSIVRFLADTGVAHGYTDLKFNPNEEHKITIVVTNTFSWLEIIAKDTNANPITKTTIYTNHDNQGFYSRDYSSNGIYLFCFEYACTQDLIMVEADGFMAESTTNIFTQCNFTTSVEFIMLPTSGELIGRMERSDGRPVASKLIMIFAIENSNIFKHTFTDLDGNFVITSINPDYHYLIYSKIPVAYPKEPIKGSEYYSIKLEPYSEVRFQALATNSLEVLKNVIYIASPTLQTNEEYSKIALLKDSFYNIIVPGSSDYYLYLRARGYKPVIIHRHFKPDEDVDLGAIYFEPELKKDASAKNK